MKPFLLGVAGPSSSGKTALAARIAPALGHARIVSLDSYYRELRGLSLAERAQVNFDHPDALDWQLLSVHLSALASGAAFDEPVYSFAEHARMPATRRVEPGKVVILEGLFLLHWPEVRELLDCSVYVDTPLDICLARRLARDIAERGRSAESVCAQYEATVRPGAERFVLPTRRLAALVVSGTAPLEESARSVLQAIAH
jgi:uridine kinase